MSTHLDQILASTIRRVSERKARADHPQLEREASAHQPRGFAASLRRAAETGPAIIAELKRASPSKGILREDYRPAVFARDYEQHGAAAISVLTDVDFFKGSLNDLQQVSASVGIPVLRKDFIVDPFQILEARAAGADAVLLLVAANDDARLRTLGAAAEALQLDVLCEVHDRVELDRALDLGFSILGVNSRNLKTLRVHPEIHFELAAELPASAVRVAESGIGSASDIQRLSAAGYNAFLIGESLMRYPDPSAQLARLLSPLSDAEPVSSSGSAQTRGLQRA